jgi:hypothetical protein
MKRIATLGMIAITIVANLNPMTTEASGVRYYSRGLEGQNATIISGNCNLTDIQNKLKDLGIDSSNYDFSKTVNSQNCSSNSDQKKENTQEKPTANSSTRNKG